MASVIKVNEIQNSGGTSSLSINGSGIVTRPNVPAFFYGKSTAQTAAGSNEVVTWDVQWLNNGSHFSSNTFTAPVDGIYSFTVYCLNNSDANQSDFKLYKNGNTTVARARNAGATGYETTSMSALVQLNATDTMQVVLTVSGDEFFGDGNQVFSGFMGHLVG